MMLVLPLTGCSALIGPSCGEYLGASYADQQQMSLDWLVFLGEAPPGSSVTEVSGQVDWALSSLEESCAVSSPYVRLHMLRPGSMPGRTGW